MIEPAIAVLIGLFVAVGVYFMLSRSIIRMLLGVTVFGNAVNLVLFTGGRLTRDGATVLAAGLYAPEGPVANPLPQALVLTAIVIGFSMFAFLLVLALRAYQAMDADNTDTMREAEPVDGGRPPMSY